MTELQTTPDAAARARSARRVRTLRDLLTFQLKLVLEGLKDIALGPMSIVAATLDFLLATEAPNRYLDGLLRLGQRYEDWLGLYRVRDASSSLPAAQQPLAQPERVGTARQIDPPS